MLVREGTCMQERSEDIAYRLHNLECDIHHTVKQVARSIRLRSLDVFDQRCVRIVEEPPGAITGKTGRASGEFGCGNARREEDGNKRTTIERNKRYASNKHRLAKRRGSQVHAGNLHIVLALHTHLVRYF
jgi:hypothetical protein